LRVFILSAASIFHLSHLLNASVSEDAPIVASMKKSKEASTISLTSRNVLRFVDIE